MYQTGCSLNPSSKHHHLPQQQSTSPIQARFNQPRSIHLSQRHIQIPSARDIPHLPRIEATRCKDSTINKKSHPSIPPNPLPQVPAPHMASVSLGVPCIVLVRLTPSPYVKKKRLMSLSVYIRSLPPSNPIHSVSPSYGHSVSIVVRWGFICCGAVSQQKGVIRQWWQAVCRGVLIKSSSERRCFTPSPAAAASRQWWMLLVAVRGTFASPAPRRIRPSGILPSLRCWRTPFRRGGV